MARTGLACPARGRLPSRLLRESVAISPRACRKSIHCSSALAKTAAGAPCSIWRASALVAANENLIAGPVVGGDASDAGKQAELDRLCEEARDEELVPIRDQIYTECLEGEKGDENYCRRYADGYNGTRIGGAPRFYELPECERAFEFRNRDRR